MINRITLIMEFTCLVDDMKFDHDESFRILKEIHPDLIKLEEKDEVSIKKEIIEEY